MTPRGRGELGGPPPSTLRALRVLCVALAFVTCAAATPAWAGEDARDDVADLEEAVRLFGAGDYQKAIPLLERVHQSEPEDLDTSLLLGISYQRTGRAGEAEPLLRAAARSSEPETAGSARTFLELDAGRAEPEAPLALYLLVRPEWDTNPALAAGALVADDAQADGALFLLGSVEACLGRAHRLCFGDTISYRRMARLTDYDTFFNLAGAAYRGRLGRHALSARYDLEVTRIGGAAFALGHLGDARWRAGLGHGFSLRAEYRIAWRDYQPVDVADLSGLAHHGVAGAGWSRGKLSLEVAATPLREDARVAPLSATGVGGRLDLRLRPVRALELAATASVTGRWFDEGRMDRRIDLDGSLTWELSPRFALLLGATLWRNDSTDDVYQATRATAYAGVDMSLDGP